VWPGVQRRCNCGGSAASGESEEPHVAQRVASSAQSAGTSANSLAPPIVHNVLRSPGQPLEAKTRAFMERRFQADFSHVRVHADSTASQSARAINALGYTVGADVVLDARASDPTSRDGLKILAHELAHVVQQRGQMGRRASPIDETPGSDAPDATWEGPPLMRLTPSQFRSDLGATPDEKTAINALFSQAQFMSLWNYMGGCKAKPAKDLGPLGLMVTPGLKISGVERFGGYSHDLHTLEINPTKPEHQANPQELVDTIVHELIHAVDDLQSSCTAAGSPPSPLAGAGTDSSAPPLAAVKGTPAEDQLLKDLGPGASNPCEEFIDVNKLAQQIIVSIIQSDIKTTKIGHPTLTFVNDAIRQDPQALADYKACRNSACAAPDADARKAAIGRCSEMIIMKYVTPLPQAPKGAAVAQQAPSDGAKDAQRTA
jgi:Domain of unknown function (DUF4157)